MSGPRLLVIGDAIIDEWRYGEVDRVSPEAACGVFRDERSSFLGRGGAAAVARMAADLGAEVTFAYARGHRWATKFKSEMGGVEEQPFDAIDRADPIKTRLVSSVGQWLRMDDEADWSMDRQAAAGWAADMFDRLKAGCFDLVLVADYGKGTLPPWLLADLLAEGMPPVIVDPARGRPASLYGGAWGVKCNSAEMAAEHRYGAHATWTITTQGIAGCRLDGGYGSGAYPALHPRPVCDPTGCGDQFLAALGCCLGLTARYFGGNDLEHSRHLMRNAIRIANAAAGMQAGLPRIGRISRAELERELDGGKVMSPEQAIRQAAFDRALGRSVVVANGCFDIFHYGHSRMLAEAKRQGDRLYALVNSDESLSAHKGRAPMIGQLQRAKMLAAAEAVDYVAIFDEPTPADLIAKMRPDVLVKGGDYANVNPAEIPGSEHAGRVHITEWVPNFSSTTLRDKVENAAVSS